LLIVVGSSNTQLIKTSLAENICFCKFSSFPRKWEDFENIYMLLFFQYIIYWFLLWIIFPSKSTLVHNV